MLSQSIDAIRVSVIAEGSELASAIPSLLEGIGILDCNITILNDFDATNQVRHWDWTFLLLNLFLYAFVRVSLYLCPSDPTFDRITFDDFLYCLLLLHYVSSF